MDLEELKKMKESVESAARDVQSGIQTNASDFEKSWSEATAGLENNGSDSSGDGNGSIHNDAYDGLMPPPPEYRHPKKNFRLKQKAVPQWFKSRTGTRTRAQSGAARVARYRPRSRPVQ